VCMLTSGVTAVLPLYQPTFLRLSSSPTSVRRFRGKRVPRVPDSCPGDFWPTALGLASKTRIGSESGWVRVR
jgi:hypothetical protein